MTKLDQTQGSGRLPQCASRIGTTTTVGWMFNDTEARIVVLNSQRGSRCDVEAFFPPFILLHVRVLLI